MDPLVSLAVEEVLASESRAVILARLESEVRETGTRIQQSIAMVLAVNDGRIVSFRFLEDSFQVSQAAHASSRAP